MTARRRSFKTHKHGPKVHTYATSRPVVTRGHQGVHATLCAQHLGTPESGVQLREGKDAFWVCQHGRRSCQGPKRAPCRWHSRRAQLGLRERSANSDARLSTALPEIVVADDWLGRYARTHIVVLDIEIVLRGTWRRVCGISSRNSSCATSRCLLATISLSRLLSDEGGCHACTNQSCSMCFANCAKRLRINL